METEIGGGTNFLDLPEGCIANVLSFTSPPDACRLSIVSSTFWNAAQSDTVWEKFLPQDYQSIISQSSDSSLPNRFSSKKQLYFSLCHNPILIDDGKKVILVSLFCQILHISDLYFRLKQSFALEKWSGNKRYMLSARDLKIVWGDTPTNWRWSSYPDSRFEQVAELICVCWLEIRGKISTRLLSPATLYKAYLVFKSTTEAYGFDFLPAEVTVGFSGNENCKRSVFLEADRGRKRRYQIGRRRIGLFNRSRVLGLQLGSVTSGGESDEQYPKERGDGWLEIELGEFFNVEGGDEDLEMSVMQVEGGHWKSGLVVQGIEIRPNESE